MPTDDAVTCDYAVIGSGAGGGTVAARLAEAGMNVVLLEAGDDYRQRSASGLPEDCDVPAFHPLASENPALRWDLFVRHYADETQQRRDCKAGPEGILYPRASTLGGCTAHNAMIFVTPDDSDWDGIAALTGDESLARRLGAASLADSRNFTWSARAGKIAAILTRDDNMNLRYRRRRAGCAKHTRCAYGSAIARFRRQAAHSARAASERSA